MQDIHSRSRLAGYDPDLLFAARFLLVGGGAIGQNVGLCLALSGIGEITVVDFDRFEPHNATRSPLFPTAGEAEVWGLEKAPVIAHQLKERATCPTPRIRYAVGPVESVGDLPIVEADVVVCAVDTLSARAYLAERCRLLRRPMVEAGFHGHDVNLAVFSDEPADPCYRCGHPERVGAFSCRRYAREADAAGIIPAIQNAAAAVGAMQSEAAIGWLLGSRDLSNHRVYFNLRTLGARRVRMARDPRCPGIHRSVDERPAHLDLGPRNSLGELLARLETLKPNPVVRPADTIVVRNFCQSCGALCDVRSPEWRWLMAPSCRDCGGEFAVASAGRMPGSAAFLTAADEELSDLPLARLGFPSGSVVEVESGIELSLYQLSGEAPELVRSL
jgi:adenylyltransferase/sulfurtransferase